MMALFGLIFFGIFGACFIMMAFFVGPMAILYFLYEKACNALTNILLYIEGKMQAAKAEEIRRAKACGYYDSGYYKN